ncbi:3-deoxy-D-manno-octulosonic acid transferase [Motiliproteus coralliicola]|uniref:3-deoxy-D-manno-octulosonic acid transferase n=1 Tax=Motiliproteus coralliicola TaxID=2283196 RepID=A0A369WZ74_9GAMM|nr:glycosyltransferase N-terminal domain-containing protein [Motiliproteus coralliicola]RDE24815.1 3-deoxy-D-manno-octulosonic acid transferase [Motiliproteus coralliicola]
MINFAEWIGWKVFYWLNRLVDLRTPVSHSVSVTTAVEQSGSTGPDIWVFCSTIGELNACRPLIEKLSSQGRLTLITDRQCYLESFQQQFPTAAVIELTGAITDCEQLIPQISPDLLVVCEIPAKPNDAPCRLSYGLLRGAKRAGSKLFLVNAWLYHYLPSCRMDRIERRWFTRAYLALFDHVTVQTQQVADELVADGLAVDKVTVSGNMKFDALKQHSGDSLNTTSRALIEQLNGVETPVFVAGCLASLEESGQLLEVLKKVKQTMPGVLVVLAPRHPENKAFMAAFLEQLEASNLTYLRKSDLIETALDSCDCLVLDTFGELKNFYAAADVCYVGCNHNVLEPLSFGKPTLISGDWNPIYPSYPVYHLTKARGLVQEAESMDELERLLRTYLEGQQTADRSVVRQQLDDLAGAADISYRRIQQDLKSVDNNLNIQ